ncbi:hypothetical protein Aduo_004432 [Ancylostoma duodenale]
MTHHSRRGSTSLMIAEFFTLNSTLFTIAYVIYCIDWLNRVEECGKGGVFIAYITAAAAAFNGAFTISALMGILMYRCDNRDDMLRNVLIG